jgi:hypothetical protein
MDLYSGVDGAVSFFIPEIFRISVTVDEGLLQSGKDIPS